MRWGGGVKVLNKTNQVDEWMDSSCDEISFYLEEGRVQCERLVLPALPRHVEPVLRIEPLFLMLS